VRAIQVVVVGGLFAALPFASAWTQEAQPPAAAAPAAAPAASDSGLGTGPATVVPHWSKYQYPQSIPEGATYYLIRRDDTLWDLAKKFLGSPFLWPQIWQQNAYIKDAHWIYPGDPLLLPKVQVVAAQAGQAGEAGLGEEAEKGLLPGEEGAAAGTGRAAAGRLIPVTEPYLAQCAPYISSGEDRSLHILGSEEGDNRISLGQGDIIYLNKGSSAGLKPGDLFTVQRPVYAVDHLGTKIEVEGWARVILTQDDSASAVIEYSCAEILAGDYLKPFEKVNVPLIARTAVPDRMTPPSGKAHGELLDFTDNATVAGAGHFALINLGTRDGLAPGTQLLIYRMVYPGISTSRDVLGDAAVLTARERNATVKILYSRAGLYKGDRIEVR
jgi:hypothetical protein